MMYSVVVMSAIGRDRIHYLQQAIDSTLRAEGDQELLLGVEEPIPAEMRAYLEERARDPRFRVSWYRCGYGFASVLNDLIETAIADPACEYIFRMDTDDLCHIDRFVAQRKYLREHPTVDVVGTLAKLIDEQAREYGEVRKSPDHATLKKMFPFDPPILHPTVAIRASVFRRGFRYPTNIVCEDLAFWATLLEAGFVFGNVQEYLLSYRQTASTYRRRRGIAQLGPALKVRVRYIWRIMPWRVDFLIVVLAVTATKMLAPASVVAKMYEWRTRWLSEASVE
jgi:hypothetical protein